MLIHLINLDRSKDRLAAFVDANKHLTAVSRVPAVDGKTLDVASLVAQGLIAEGLVVKDFYTIGALGAAFSHISLWQTAIETNQVLTIAEDDAVFHGRFETLAPQVMQKLPPEWDLVSWGWNFDLFMCFEMLPGVSHCLAQFEQDRMRGGVGAFQRQTVDPQVFKLIWQFGIPCYTISPKGAKALVSKSLPLKPRTSAFPPGARVQPWLGHFRNVGIDSVMNDAWTELKAFACFPPLVISKNEAVYSTIQHSS
jgi:GR25 family glycosyltransferase involved in LPS biosynthesis